MRPQGRKGRFGVDKNKDPKKLNAEELEKRVAPLALTYTDPTTDPTDAPTSTTTDKDLKGHGGGGGTGGGKNQA